MWPFSRGSKKDPARGGEERADEESPLVARGGSAAEYRPEADARHPRVADDDGRAGRRWPRISLNAEARLQSNKLGPEITARILNASERGLFLAMDAPKPIGTHIRITIDVADPQLHVVLRGVVIHAVTPDQPRAGLPPGVGIFLEDAEGAWIEFCRRVAADPKPAP